MSEIMDERNAQRIRNKKIAPPRKKACTQCSNGKTRCDMRRPRCSSCMKKGLECHYTVAPAFDSAELNESIAPAAEIPDHEFSSSISETTDPGSSRVPPWNPIRLPSQAESETPYTLPTPQTSHSDTLISMNRREQSAAPASLNFTDVELVPVADSSQIGDRWLAALLSSTPPKRPKHLSPVTARYLYRVLKTYPKMMLRPGSLPPIIHPLQLAGHKPPAPLANCLSLVRMWENRAIGSETIADDIVRREMERLYREHETYDQETLLVACQAYFTYAIMTFSPGESISLTDQTTMVNLQTLGSRAALQGLVCREELSNTRPNWEDWIVASAKRRTLYAMYMFDNVFNSFHGIPCFIGDELASLPAPASKTLWSAMSKEVWEQEYNFQLARWEGGILRLGELWPQLDPVGTKREKRINCWLESVDEFGMMLFATVVHTYGE